MKHNDEEFASTSAVRSGTRVGPRVMAAVGATVLVLAGLTTTAATVAVADTVPPSGTPTTVAADGLPTWQVNGVVWSQAIVRNTVYATGSFSKARPPGVAAGGAGEVAAMNIFAYDITTGNRVTSFNHSLNAQGLAVTASPDGSRIYVGGDFTSVDGLTRGHVAAFNTADNTLNRSWAPNVSNEVRAVAATNSTVYLGGSYGSVNGAARSNLSAVAATGSLLPWAPSIAGGNVDVWSMVVTPDQSRVVVGGSFTSLNGVAASGMGSLDATTGAAMPWAANTTIRNGGTGSAITSLRTDGSQIYGSGYAYGSGNFEGTFAANPTTGAITVVNDCHGDTYDVLPLGAVLYSVSHVHDCSWIGSFPDTNPRVRWEHALAQTIAPGATNKGPDNYGWSYNGRPASRVLHWFPQLSTGSYTGQYQAAWSLAGNSSYVVMGGEFPRVNGVAQQGLVRMAVSSLAPNKQGPTYTTQPDRPTPATTASSPSAGTVSVSFGTAWDYDNETLTYDLFRDGASTPVKTAIKSNFWTLPTRTMTDTAVPGGSHTYQVRITDPFGNTLWSPKSNSVSVAAGANVAPTASFTAAPNGLSVAVDGTASRDSDGTIASYAWTFGDGGTASGATASHTYAAPGTYSVTLKVTDNAGATNTASKSVTVAGGNTAPTASFTVSTSGLTTTVNGSGSSDPDGTITAYTWTFGDGGTATGATASHTYGAGGTYDVTLKVTDNSGATNSVTKSVTVTTAPSAAYATDAFNRSTSNGWGSADLGGAWAVSGTLSRWSVGNGVGNVSLSPGTSGTASLSSVSKSDTEVAASVAASTTATGGGQYLSVIARQASSTVDYRSKLRVSPNGTVDASITKMVSGTETTLSATITLPGVTLVPNDRLQMRMQAVGTSPTTLRFKAWKVGTSEPTAWTVTATDSTTGLQTAGAVGLYGYLSSSTTNAPTVISFDNVWVGPSRP